MTTTTDPTDLTTLPPDTLAALATGDDPLSQAIRDVTRDEPEDSVSAFNSAL